VTKSRRRSCRSPASWPQWSVAWSVTSHILPCWSSASKACSLWTSTSYTKDFHLPMKTGIYPRMLALFSTCF
jgi:hypothetical protein